MKNIHFLAVIVSAFAIFSSQQVQAQTQSIWTGPGFGTASISNLVAGDTVVNVDTVFKVMQTTAGYKDLGFQCLVNKLSGTVTGKMFLWASMDGINYVVTDSATYGAPPGSTRGKITPTFTYTASIGKTGSPYVWYAILVTNTATGTAQVRIRATLRRQQVSVVYP